MALANVHHFTTDEFLAIDGLPRRIELIDGVICDMSPEGPLQALAQETVLRALMTALPNWSVVAGGSVQVTENFCPIPDVAVYPKGMLDDDQFFLGRNAELIVEVGVATEWSDRSVKLSGYAAGDIEEVWLVAPGAKTLTCHRAPRDGRYDEELEVTWPGGLAKAVERLATRLAT